MDVLEISLCEIPPKNFSGILQYVDFINGEKISQKYLVDGKLHRIDGPAYINLNDEEFYYLNGKFYYQPEWEYILSNNLDYDYKKWTKGELVLFILSFEDPRDPPDLEDYSEDY